MAENNSEPAWIWLLVMLIPLAFALTFHDEPRMPEAAAPMDETKQ